jgi:GDP-mannose pyrophosphatase NudK
MQHSRPLFILIAGPYRSNTADDPAKIEQNLRAMTQAALKVFRLGHLPVLGESLALPLISEADHSA